LCSARDFRKPVVPVAQEQPQLVAEFREIAESGFQFGKPLGYERAGVPTRGSATVALREDSRQAVQRESDSQCPSDHPNASDRFGSIETIAALAARRNPNDTFALVVAQRIRADPRQPRELRWTHCAPFKCGSHWALSC